jgi:hypothetical protein
MLPIVRTYLVADLVCLWCGRTAGFLQQQQGQARTISEVIFRQAAGHPEAAVAEDGLIRCGHCGGPTFINHVDMVRQRVEARSYWKEPRRRGRPRKSRTGDSGLD